MDMFIEIDILKVSPIGRTILGANFPQHGDVIVYRAF